MQSAWVAFSALYPQAFDEQFHFGIIQVYSHHWLPFLRSQPLNADPYGAVARDPSFLYHYAMSFPYRIIELFTHDQTIQIIDLRLINVAFFALGLVLFHKVLRRSGLSEITANASIFVTALIPVAPQLAGQINYDNLLLPLTAWACLLTFDVIDRLQRRRFTIQSLLGLLTVCICSSMVKYEFLPIFLAITIFLVVFAWHHLKGHWRTAWQHASQDWKQGSSRKWLLIAAFLVAFCFFAERDLGNVVMYHTIVPDCSQILTIQQCSAYSVWIHDYTSHQAVVAHTVHVNPDPIIYLGEWIYWMWYRLFFAINGQTYNFKNYPPLPLPAAAFAVLLILSVVAVIVRGGKIFKDRPYLELSGVMVLIYLFALFGAGYEKYLQTDVLELMNGRYLFPILLPGVAIAIPAVREFTRGWSSNFRYVAACILLCCFLEGGGIFTFISRSDSTWYWESSVVYRMNDMAKRVLEPIIIDGPRSYSSSRWYFN